MARIDRILAIVVDQGANELRVGTDREPQMFAYGARKRLMLPPTPDDMLRDLLGNLLSGDREREVRAKGHLEVDYDAGELGFFRAKLVAREGGLDATLIRASQRREASGASAPRVAPPSAPVEIVPASANLRSAASTSVASVSAIASPTNANAYANAPAQPTATAAGALASPALRELVARAAALRASDLHLAERDTPRARVDGKLRAIHDGPAPDLSELFGLGSGDVAWLASGRTLDLGLDAGEGGSLRAHVYKTSEGLAAAIRMLAPAAPSLASLRIQAPLHELVLFPHGLVLVCGPTGSGKSTTLAALAQHALQRRSMLLVTLEDPIEYHLSPGPEAILRRRQIGRDVADFAGGLRDALREDIDVLLVGELRDAETIQLALTAAETGHLVLASIHSRSAASAISRIIDAYPAGQQDQARSQLADALRAVVAQRLVPRARGSGRVAAIELLRTTPAVSALIREGKQSQLATAMQSGKNDGMTTLERSLVALVQSGEIDLEQARAAANDPTSLAMLLR